jgi:O-antigen/teichoic acid export membrane protein
MTEPKPDGRHAIRRKVAAGAAFMIAGRLAVRSVSIVSTLILARLLVPEDFGLVALASSIFMIMDLLSSTNFALVVVRRSEVDRSFYDTAWTMNLLRSLLLAAVVCLTAPFQADLLGDARLAPLLLLIGFNVALDGLTSIGFARLQREFRFDLLFRYQVVGRLTAFAITVVIAAAWQSYWALILGNVIAKVVSLPYGYWLAPHRPRLSLKHWRELLSFSKWSIALNACLIADGQGPNLVLGRLLGAPAVGSYNIAYQVAATPVTEIAVPIRGPLYSGYAGTAHDKALLSGEFLSGFGILFTALVPLSVGIALVAPEIQRIALGPKWAGIAPFMTLCALYALIDAIGHFTFNLFTVLDRMARFTGMYAVMMMVRVPAVIAGAMWWGTEGALAAMLATGILNALVWHAAAGRLVGHSLLDVFRLAWRPILAALVMVAAVLGLRGVLPPQGGDFAMAVRDLVVLASAGAVAHVATQMVLWRLAGAPASAERRLLRVATGLCARFRTRSLAVPR